MERRNSRRTLAEIMVQLCVPLLGCWLLVWVCFSWGAMRDDALIHLRYADFLYRVHFITFDGVHHTYGTSSLFYVALLAALRPFFTSPLLPGGVSAIFHLLLFSVLAVYFYRHVRMASTGLQVLTVILLLTMSAPSAVRWLDDGMETGLVLLAVGATAWLTHRLSLETQIRLDHQALLLLLGTMLVLLRTELIVLCVLVFAVLCVTRIDVYKHPVVSDLKAGLRWTMQCSSILAGSAVAVVIIFLIFHTFLPDTAIAKSHGGPAFLPILQSTMTVLAGGMLFGFGTMALWLLTGFAVLRLLIVHKKNWLPTLAANALFPLIFLSSALRGQEIQGARYLVWTFFFSICWNLLELLHLEEHPHRLAGASYPSHSVPAYTLLILCLVIMPFEGRPIHRSLNTQKHTLELLREENLAPVLHGRIGVAGDVGAIGYFTQADICDLAGLVNGRTAASRTLEQRVMACTAEHPDFAFVNAWQYDALGTFMDLSGWVVCGAPYESSNLHSADPHVLLVRPALADSVCTVASQRTVSSTFPFLRSGTAQSTN